MSPKAGSLGQEKSNRGAARPPYPRKGILGDAALKPAERASAAACYRDGLCRRRR